MSFRVLCPLLKCFVCVMKSLSLALSLSLSPLTTPPPPDDRKVSSPKGSRQLCPLQQSVVLIRDYEYVTGYLCVRVCVCPHCDHPCVAPSASYIRPQEHNSFTPHLGLVTYTTGICLCLDTNTFKLSTEFIKIQYMHWSIEVLIIWTINYTTHSCMHLSTYACTLGNFMRMGGQSF